MGTAGCLDFDALQAWTNVYAEVFSEERAASWVNLSRLVALLLVSGCVYFREAHQNLYWNV